MHQVDANPACANCLYEESLIHFGISPEGEYSRLAISSRIDNAKSAEDERKIKTAFVLMPGALLEIKFDETLVLPVMPVVLRENPYQLPGQFLNLVRPL